MLAAAEQMELDVLKKHGASIRELLKLTGHSRNTVRRYPREGDAAACASRRRNGWRSSTRLYPRAGEGSGPAP